MAALVTPPGTGGIAVIEVCGPRAGAVVERVFRPKSRRHRLRDNIDALHYGHIVDGDRVVDEVIVRLAAADRIEVNCHGGIVPAAEVMRLLVEGGAREAEGGAFARLTAARLGLDPIQADALALLPHAQTGRAAQMLCDQLNGALSRAIEGIDAASDGARGQIHELVRSAEYGLALIRPRRVALIGRPNVGKSTLFNALVGHDRTIVSPVPGTTRDFVNELIALRGYPVELIDTAGLRRRGGLIEMKGVTAAWRVVADADLVVLVVDASSRFTPTERGVAETLRDRHPIIVLNKADLPARLADRSLPKGIEFVRLSALSGVGVDALREAIVGRLPVAGAYPHGAPVVFTPDQARVLATAAGSCAAGRVEQARRELRALLQHPESF